MNIFIVSCAVLGYILRPMPLLKSPNFRVSSAEYYIDLLSLGRDYNVARLDTRAPGSLRLAVGPETSWPRQWLCYLAAVVSISMICEYTASNKGGLPCHCHDCGRLWGVCPHALYIYFLLATSCPPPPPVPPPMETVWLLQLFISHLRRVVYVTHPEVEGMLPNCWI